MTLQRIHGGYLLCSFFKNSDWQFVRACNCFGLNVSVVY